MITYMYVAGEDNLLGSNVIHKHKSSDNLDITASFYQDHRTIENIFKSFYHIWVWWPSWPCDLDHLYRFSFPLAMKAPHGFFGFDWPSGFREDV